SQDGGARFFTLGLTVRMLGALLDLLQDSIQVVGRRGLHRRVGLERLEFLHPQLLADGQHVPVVLKCGHRATKRASEAHGRLRLKPTACSKGSRLMFWTRVKWNGTRGNIQPSGPG